MRTYAQKRFDSTKSIDSGLYLAGSNLLFLYLFRLLNSNTWNRIEIQEPQIGRFPPRTQTFNMQSVLQMHVKIFNCLKTFERPKL